MKKIILSLFLVCVAFFANADDLSPLYRKVKCLTCNGQSIAESSSTFSMDLKNEISELHNQGCDEKCILDRLVSKYGSEILFDTPADSRTAWLWYLPYFLLIVICIFTFRKQKIFT